jgi:hypothetical protein
MPENPGLARLYILSRARVCYVLVLTRPRYMALVPYLARFLSSSWRPAIRSTLARWCGTYEAPSRSQIVPVRQ